MESYEKTSNVWIEGMREGKYAQLRFFFSFLYIFIYFCVILHIDTHTYTYTHNTKSSTNSSAISSNSVYKIKESLNFDRTLNSYNFGKKYRTVVNL